MKNRSILIIVENLPVPFDTRVWQEATTLVNNGYIVSVICPKGKNYTKDKEVINGVNIFRHDLPKEGNGFISYAKEYFYALKEEIRLAKIVYKEIGFNVIQGCNPPDNIFLVYKFFKKYGVKYVFDHHDVCPELYEAKFEGKHNLLYKSQLLLERLTYKNCSLAFVTNNSYKNIAIKRDKMNSNSIFVLRSGPDLKRMKIIKPDIKLKNNYKYMVGYLGVIGKQEGIKYILEAARYIKKHDNNVYWCIIGSGPYLETNKKLCSKLKLNDCVLFTGRVSDEVMLKYLNTSDICVNSDEYNSMNNISTMNKILEYMSLKKPIVQFDLKEGRYSAGKSSLYAKRNDSIDLANKIVYLLKNENIRNKMGKIGYERIINIFSWDITSKKLLDGYDKLFKEIEKN